jgi:hypothetical protein
MKPPDIELTLIEDTLAQISRSSFSVPRIFVANFLVALKSKPLIILASPPDTAKETIVEAFSTVLIGNDSTRYQAMTGHPWWANQTEDVATYTATQSRFNTLKLESILEEAGLSENQGRFFIAELKKISPGELEEYFSEIAFQIRHGQLMRLPTSHFSEPVPFPSNLSIIGTMDTNNFNWLDHDLLSQTTILQCAPFKSLAVPLFRDITGDPMREKSLIQSSIRDPQQAFRKLFGMLRKFSSALLPFLQVKKILEKDFSTYSGNLLAEGIIYLANSWSFTGLGLFDDDTRKNLQIATDLAITQSLLLPCSEKITHSESLQIKLHKVLDNHFPHSIAYINQLIPT